MKCFVVDSNVLLSNPNFLNSFIGHNVVIPIYVLEEIDKFKNESSERGRNAREVIRNLDKLARVDDLKNGVSFSDEDGKVWVHYTTRTIPPEMAVDSEKFDNKILATVLDIKLSSELEVVFVTNDINLRLRAQSLGLKSEEYKALVVSPSEFQQEIIEQQVDKELIDYLYKGDLITYPSSWNPDCNSFGVLTAYGDPQSSILVRFSPQSQSMSRLNPAIKSVFGIRPRNKEQQFALELLLDPAVELVCISGPAGGGKSLLALAAGLQQVVETKQYNKVSVGRPIQPLGKDVGFLPGPQPLTAKILTPTGWTYMKDLRIGDEIISRNGKPTKILQIFPKGIKPVYKLTTTDGTSTRCCLDHLWLTQTFEEKKRGKLGQLRTTKQILNTLKYNKKINHYLPRNEPVEFTSTELPLSPYVLGVLIGDGNFGDNISFASPDRDNEIKNRVEKEIGNLGVTISTSGISHNLKKVYSENNKPARSIQTTNLETGVLTKYPRIGIALESINMKRSTLHHLCRRKAIVNNIKYEFINDAPKWTNSIKQAIYDLGLISKKAEEKFIPNCYKYNSIENRLALLQGLMDTDGTIKENGEASFSTTSFQLAKDIQELVRSLGGRATIHSRDRRVSDGQEQTRAIVSRLISYEFTISMPKDLNPFYLTRKAKRHQCKYIHDAKIESIEFISEEEVQCILVDNEEHLYITDDFLVTHNTLDEKLRPWMQPVYDCLEFLMGTGTVEAVTKTKKTLKLQERGNVVQKKTDELFEFGYIQIEPLTYIRGRSIPRQYFWLDEIQNSLPLEAKTFITRVGEGTKIVLTGDVSQIDLPFIDSTNNGLVHIMKAFKNHPLAGSITLSRGERSNLASEAARLL